MEKKLDIIHKELYSMMEEFHVFCEKNDLEYFLAYGTLLGKVRHGSIIPWDDDIDLLMPRESYKKLIEIFRKSSIKERYNLITPLNRKNYKALFYKIESKRVGLVYDNDEDNEKGISLSIDIFPLDKTCKFYLFELTKGILVKGLQLMYGIKKTIQFNKKGIVVKKPLSFNILKNIFRPVVFFISSKNIYIILNKLMTIGKSKKTRMYTVRRDVSLKKFTKKDVFPLKKDDFNGMLFYVPNKEENILEIVYGDYMKLPPKDKQKPHHNVKEIIIKEELI